MKLSQARLALAIAMSCLVVVASWTTAGFNGGRGNAVGGVSIDPAGVVRSATVQENQALVNFLRNDVAVPGGLDQAADMRMVSLRGLQETITDVRKSGGRLPADVQFLAGLTSIDYVLVDQENHDLILAGPAEPWELSDTGSVVGTETGSAIMRLEDLVVALRNVEASRAQGISCSIEPTAEGRNRLNAFLKRVTLRPGQNPSILEAGMKQAFGPQMIKLTGIPQSSRYACTLVAADYQMKRLAMAIESSPIKGLPSYLELARNSSRAGNENPRWWMECDYESLTRNEAGTVWKLSGQGVKTMTEQDVIAADGQASASGRKDPLAQKWADMMTEEYVALAKEMPIFGDLQNLMDLTVASTLIVQEQLEQHAQLDLAVLRDEQALSPIAFDAPQSVSPECSFIRARGGKWLVTTSGGVSINAFQVVHDQTVDPSLDDQLIAKASQSWWWNKD